LGAALGALFPSGVGGVSLVGAAPGLCPDWRSTGSAALDPTDPKRTLWAASACGGDCPHRAPDVGLPSQPACAAMSAGRQPMASSSVSLSCETAGAPRHHGPLVCSSLDAGENASTLWACSIADRVHDHIEADAPRASKDGRRHGHGPRKRRWLTIEGRVTRARRAVRLTAEGLLRHTCADPLLASLWPVRHQQPVAAMQRRDARGFWTAHSAS
jgi:hypothetical protein